MLRGRRIVSEFAVMGNLSLAGGLLRVAVAVGISIRLLVRRRWRGLLLLVVAGCLRVGIHVGARAAAAVIAVVSSGVGALRAVGVVDLPAAAFLDQGGQSEGRYQDQSCAHIISPYSSRFGLEIRGVQLALSKPPTSCKNERPWFAYRF